MTDNIIEMTAKEFRQKLTEMVRMEIAKHLMEAEEGSVEEPTETSSEEEKQLTTIVDRRLSSSEAGKFLQYVKTATQDPEFQAVNSFKEFVALVVKKHPEPAAAKKFVEDLVTGFRIGKTTKTAEPADVQAKHQSRAEAILSSIHDMLTVTRGAGAKEKTQQNFVGFANWIKKNYPTITDTADDSVTTLTKYADFFAGNKIPVGKSWKEDLNIFKTASKVSMTAAEIEASQAKDQARADRIKAATAKNVSVAGLENALGVEEVGKAIGTSGKTIGNILQAIPAGKGNAIYLALKNSMLGDDVVAARRTLKDFDAIFKKAVVSAKKEFIMLIEEAGELEPEENMITKDNLAKVIQDAGFRNDLSPAEMANEDIFLEHIADIVNSHGEEEWKALVPEMLQLDLEEQGQNVMKSFQNMVAMAMGAFDPASFSPKRGAPSKHELERRANVEKQFGNKFKVSGREEEPTT